MAGYWSIAISAGERLQMCVLVEKEGAVFGRGGRGQARRQAAHRFAISMATGSGTSTWGRAAPLQLVNDGAPS
eukprot:scaffold65938_cov54-Phaeocystis_antarctica.AAC.2